MSAFAACLLDSQLSILVLLLLGRPHVRFLFLLPMFRRMMSFFDIGLFGIVGRILLRPMCLDVTSI
jgi:hypothetical protein